MSPHWTKKYKKKKKGAEDEEEEKKENIMLPRVTINKWRDNPKPNIFLKNIVDLHI